MIGSRVGENEDTAEIRRTKRRTVAAHIACVTCSLIFAGFYLFTNVFTRYYSGTFLNIMRGVTTLPVIAVILCCSFLSRVVFPSRNEFWYFSKVNSPKSLSNDSTTDQPLSEGGSKLQYPDTSGCSLVDETTEGSGSQTRSSSCSTCCSPPGLEARKDANCVQKATPEGRLIRERLTDNGTKACISGPTSDEAPSSMLEIARQQAIGHVSVPTNRWGPCEVSATHGRLGSSIEETSNTLEHSNSESALRQGGTPEQVICIARTESISSQHPLQPQLSEDLVQNDAAAAVSTLRIASSERPQLQPCRSVSSPIISERITTTTYHAGEAPRQLMSRGGTDRCHIRAHNRSVDSSSKGNFHANCTVDALDGSFPYPAEPRDASLRTECRPGKYSRPVGPRQACATAGMSLLEPFIIRHTRGVLSVVLSMVVASTRQIVIPIALMFTSVGSAGIVQPATPIFTAFFAILAGLEKLNRFSVLALLICGGGLFLSQESWIIGTNIGFLMLLWVPVSKGIQVVAMQLATKHRTSTESVWIYQAITVMALTMPLSLLLELFIFKDWDFGAILEDIQYMDGQGWLAVWYSSIAVTLVGFGLQIYAIKVLGAMTVGFYQALQPPFAIFLAYLLLNEPVEGFELLGSVLVVASLVIYAYGKGTKVCPRNCGGSSTSQQENRPELVPQS